MNETPVTKPIGASGKLIEKVPGSVLSFVYVGGSCLFVFPTNQQAWEKLSSLIVLSGDDRGFAWPEEVYLVLALVDSVGIRVPQIGKVDFENDRLVYRNLWGEAHTDFSNRVIADWPTIKEGLGVGKLLHI